MRPLLLTLCALVVAVPASAVTYELPPFESWIYQFVQGTDDVTSVFVNPAGLAQRRGTNGSLDITTGRHGIDDWSASLQLGFLGLAYRHRDLHGALDGRNLDTYIVGGGFGPRWFRDLSWPVPNLLMAGVPGFEKVATGLMKKTFRNKGVASIEELRSLSVDAGAKLIACQMTVDVFGFSSDEFIPEVDDYVGAASFLPVAQKSDVTLFI